MKEIIKLSDIKNCGVWHKAPNTRSSLDEAIKAIGANRRIFSGNMFNMTNPSKPNDAYTVNNIAYCTGGIQYGLAFKPPNFIANTYLNQVKYPSFLGGSYVRINTNLAQPIQGTFSGSSRRASFGLLKNGNLYIHYTNVNKTVKAMAEEAIADGCQYWYNLDGGGTVQWHNPNIETYYGTDPKRKALNWWWLELKPSTSTRPTIKRGSTGENVKVLQTILPGLKADGLFGPLTETAVKIYQRSKNLEPDGIVGPKTWGSLNV